MNNSFIQVPQGFPAQSYKLRVIYCYSIPGDSNYIGAVKVGMTEVELPLTATEEGKRLMGRNAASKRINKNLKEIYGQVSGKNLPDHILHWHETAHISIRDHQVHAQLTNSGVSQPAYALNLGQREWFECTPEVAHSAFGSVAAGLPSILNNNINYAAISLRPEQANFVTNTLDAWHSGDTDRLWNAKPRFGKTFTALEFVGEARNSYIADNNKRRIEKVLILTHRPVVNAGWAKDFTNIMSQRWGKQNWQYASKDKAHQTLDQAKAKHSKDASPFIYFVSMQDARGKDGEGFKLSNGQLFNIDWDLVIIDEAHEGNLTELAQEVHQELTRSFSLFLSGTPFKHLSNGTFDGKTDSWDYIDEQEAKECWDYSQGANPYIDLPRMWIYTLDLSSKLKTSFGLDEDTGSFSFTELFTIEDKKTKNAKFKHEADIANFLNTLVDDTAIAVKHADGSNIDMPYSDNGRRDSRHSVWVLPQDVQIAALLEKMLKSHPEFSKYTVVNVAGDAAGTKPLAKVENAIYNGNTELRDPTQSRTITLTVGRLTTGVTVEPWTTILMLNNMTSAEAYMQTIFRVQSPHTYNGMVKSECFVYDFAPDRALRVIAEAHSIASKAGHSTPEEYVARLQKLTNYLPILSSVDRGSLERADAKFITHAIKRIYRERVLAAGFDTGLLFKRDLQNLTEEQRAALDEVRVAAGKNSPVTREKVSQDVVISANGLDNYKYAATDEELSKEIKDLETAIQEELVKECTPEELAELEERKAELEERKAEEARRKNIRNILRTMSVRIPAMCIALAAGGPESSQELKENFTLEKFAEAFDSESWREFFGTITKETFLTLAPCFDEEVLQVAVEGWIKELESTFELRDSYSKNRLANLEEARESLGEFEISMQGTMSRIKNPNKETVFTPYPVVGRQYEIAGFTLDPAIIDDMIASYRTATNLNAIPSAGEVIIDHCFKGLPWEGFKKADAQTPLEFGKAISTSDEVMPTFYDVNVKSGLYPLYAAIQIAKANPQLSWEEICNNLIYANSRTLAGKWITCAILGMPKDWGNITAIDVYEELLSEDLAEAKLTDEEKQQFVGHFLLAPLRSKRFRNDDISDITNESHRTRIIEIIKQGQKKMADQIGTNDADDSTQKLNQDEGLRFDFVISNPPYQIETGGKKHQIYDKFYFVAKNISSNLSIICPLGWQTSSGRGSGSAQHEKIRKDPNIIKVDNYYEDSSKSPIVLFSTASTGGVSIINARRHYENRGSVNFYEYNEPKGRKDFSTILVLSAKTKEIFEHLNKFTEEYGSISHQIGSRNQFGVRGYITQKNRAENKYVQETSSELTIQCMYDHSKKDKAIKFINILKTLPEIKTKDIVLWKTVFPKSGAYRIWRDNWVLPPGIIITDKYLSVLSKSEKEAKNWQKLLATDFYYFMLTETATDHNAMSTIHRFVPDINKMENPRTKQIGLNSEWTDEDIFDVFELTESQIHHIKNIAKNK